jgi:SOS-response transcriptional repressor LexA
MPLSDRLTLAMSSAGISQAELARACKVKPPSVHGWLSGKAKFLRGENLLLAAAALGVNQQWLATGEGPMLPGSGETATHANTSTGPDIKGTYPLISKVQAGAWTELCDHFQPGQADEWLPSTKNLGKCGYMLRVEGKSMENPTGKPSFAEGMVLHVNPHLDPVPGNYVVVRRNSTLEATFKRYVLIDGEKYLEAINPDWPKDMKYLPLQPGDEWCGVVVDASLGGLI